MNHNYFHTCLSNDEWLLHESGDGIESQPIDETLFTLGNGYVGSRGVYEERPPRSQPGTYFAGIFDHIASHEALLINAPNPFHLSFSLPQEEKFSIFKTPIESHKRVLDLQTGLLYRHTIFKAPESSLFDYQSIRFISMNDLHVAVTQTIVSPLSVSSVLMFDVSIDLNVTNQGIRSNIQTFNIEEQEQTEDLQFLRVQSLDHQTQLAYAQQTVIHQRGKQQPVFGTSFQQLVHQGDSIVITKFITFYTSRDVTDPSLLKDTVLQKLHSVVGQGFTQLLEEHSYAFKRRWESHDIVVKGDDDVQSSLRFNLYQLIIAAHPQIKNVSVGAKMLSGEGYKGHIFWETELLLLPCYVFAEPSIARGFLEYRYHRLPAAKKITEARGYKGVLFPWESADTGLDETPVWTEDFDGTMKYIQTGHNSLHINLAIFYALYTYYIVTNDIDFMLQMGLSMMIEMARFWKSRVVHNKSKDIYKLKKVMGPDEFHEEIDNNAYTNKLVAWSFDRTLFLLLKFQTLYPHETKEILRKHKFFDGELRKLKRIAEKMYIPTQDGLILQFDRFNRLRETSNLSLNVHGLPNFPADFLVRDLFKTQYVKQPDVILLLFLLPTFFGRESAEKNFLFYDMRTLHKSSWSPPIHSAVAAQLGLQDKAYHYLTITLNSDKKNVFGNTREGIHTPAVGGSWLAIVYGLCGLRPLEDRLVIMPNLPPNWSCVSFKVLFRDIFIHIFIDQYAVSLRLENSPITDHSIRLQICNTIIELQAGSECILPIETSSIFNLASQHNDENVKNILKIPS